MSSKVKFTCDFCHDKITSGAAYGGQFGVCLAERSHNECRTRTWSNHLTNKLDGPHICKECIESIIEYIGE